MPMPTTIRLDKGTLERLDRLASILGRSRAWVIKEAVAQYLEREEKRFRGVEQGLQEVRQGYISDQSKVEAHFIKRGFKNVGR